MLRRSQRVQAKKDASATAAASKYIAGLKPRDADDNEHQVQRDEDGIPNKKRRKSKGASASNTDEPNSSTNKQRMPNQFRKVRGKLGLLQRLAKDVPLDVILEIFCYLEPRDLLRLARTTKDLRGMLMTKSSVNIWRSALENVEGLPPCPPDLNEPQYANLLFEPHCHICMHSGRCDNILWNFRMRACQKCVMNFPNTLFDCIGGHPLSRGPNSDVIPREVAKISGRYYDLWNMEIAQRYRAEYDALETVDRDAWLTRTRNERRALKEHSRECVEWCKLSFKTRADELDVIRKERRAAILDRLQEIGLREEAETVMQDPFYNATNEPFSNHKLVRQAKKLTDYGWDSIKDELVSLLAKCKDDRADREQEKLFDSRALRARKLYDAILSKSDLREPFPSIGDVLSHEKLQDLLWDTPDDDSLTDDILRSKLLEHLPESVEEWRDVVDHYLLERVLQASRPTATHNDLHLATSVFKCIGCYQPLYYPQLYYHRCYALQSFFTIFDENDDGTIDYHRPWTHRSLRFSETHAERAEMIVKACSLDPNTVTFQEMYDANPLIECTTCTQSTPEHGRCFMRWPLPLVHPQNHSLTVVNLNEQERKKVDACEPNITSSFDLPIRCAHCHFMTSVDDFIDHLKTEHSDSIDLQESDNPPKLQALRTHWYWNPRMPLDSMGEPFRYKDDSD
ncbi:hypothetical protein FB446DRAFT_790599 [Lentinula raphanica]|nr:hypothetical protein FB446DRAFT_790599 [Lentinula raphanica]